MSVNELTFAGDISYMQRVSHVYVIMAGATPNETTSDRESSSLPISPLTFSMRATKPSKKSKTAEMIMQTAAASKLPLTDDIIDMQPDTRFRQVNVLGICFFKGILWVISYELYVILIPSIWG